MRFLLLAFLSFCSLAAIGQDTHVVTNLTEWDAVFAGTTASLEGDTVEIDGVITTRLTIDDHDFTTGITVTCPDAADEIQSVLLDGTTSNITFDGVNFQMTGWPKTERHCVFFNNGTFSGIEFQNCTFRHGYGASLVDFVTDADLAEYDRVDNVQTATTTTATYALTWKDATADDAWVEFFNRGVEDVYVTFGGSGVTTSTGTGTLCSPGVRTRFTSLDPTTDTHVAIIADANTSEINARTEVGLSYYLAEAFGSSGSAVMSGDLLVSDCTFSDLNNAIKGLGQPTGTIKIYDNTATRIYQDTISISPGGPVEIKRNKLPVPFARSGTQEANNGDAHDPHGDSPLQVFSNDGATIASLDIEANTTFRNPVRTGVVCQGLFITDNDVSPSYRDLRLVGNILIGGAANGVNLGEGSFPVDGVLDYGNTVAHHSDITVTTNLRTWSTATGPVVSKDSVYKAFLNESGVQITRDSYGFPDLTDATTIFSNYAGLQTAQTRAEVEAALTTVGPAANKGAVAIRALCQDFATTNLANVTDYSLVPSGAGWVDQTQVARSTLITSALCRIVNPNSGQTVVPGAGVEWRSVDTDGATEVQAWTTSSGTINNGQYLQIRATSSPSFSTITNPTVTVNGFAETFAIETVGTITNGFLVDDVVFESDTNAPANTSVIEYEAKVRFSTVPSSGNLFEQVSAGRLIFAAQEIYPNAIEDDTQVTLYTDTSTRYGGLQDGVVHTVNLLIDHDNETVVLTVDDVVVIDGVMNASSGAIQTNRAFQVLENMPSDTEVEYVRVWLTTNSTRSLFKEISVSEQGSIAGINSDPWVSSGSVTEVTGPPNSAPTDITLSNNSIAENNTVFQAVGTFTATDPDVGDSFTFALVEGVDDTHNDNFRIVGNELQAETVFDFETLNDLEIRVEVTDSGSATFEKVFGINVTDVDDTAPTIVSAACSGSQIRVVYSEAVSFALLPMYVSDEDSTTLTNGGNFAADTINYNMSRTAEVGEAIYLDLPAGAVTDSAGNNLAASFYEVTNNSSGPVTPTNITIVSPTNDDLVESGVAFAINVVGNNGNSIDVEVSYDDEATWQAIATNVANGSTITLTTLGTVDLRVSENGNTSNNSTTSVKVVSATPEGVEIAASEVAELVLAKLASETIQRVGPGFDPDSQKWALVKNKDHVFETNGHEDFLLDMPAITDWTGWTAQVWVKHSRTGERFQGTATIVDVGDDKFLRVEFPGTATASATPSSGYVLQADLVSPTSMKHTKVEGPLTLKSDSSGGN